MFWKLVCCRLLVAVTYVRQSLLFTLAHWKRMLLSGPERAWCFCWQPHPRQGLLCNILHKLHVDRTLLPSRLSCAFYVLTEMCNVCRTKGISLNLMGMATPEEVKTDVQIVLEALGVVPSKTAALEAEVLPEVQAILKPVMNTTWKTGLQDNRK